MKRVLLATLLSSSLLLSSSAVAQEQPIPPTLLQRIRQLLGLVQPVAAGGSRGNSKQLCLISPFVASQQEGAVTPTATPTIRVLQPLNEVRIEKDGLTLWRKVASSSQAIEGLISWPLAPLEPGDQLQLVLRSRGASGADAARIPLRAASAAVLDETRALLKSVEDTPSAWESAMGDALQSNNQPLAVVLLNAKATASSNRDGSLEQLIQASACGGKGHTPKDTLKSKGQPNKNHSSHNIKCHR